MEGQRIGCATLVTALPIQVIGGDWGMHNLYQSAPTELKTIATGPQQVLLKSQQEKAVFSVCLASGVAERAISVKILLNVVTIMAARLLTGMPSICLI